MLFRRSEDSEAQILTVIGMAAVATVAVVIASVTVVNPFGAKAKDHYGIIINTAFVGQGVAPGTALVMHGVKVGEVTGVTSLRGQRLELSADLQRGPTVGLTDTMSIDFRPANYFGVTGINLQPGRGGQPLAEGTQLTVTPTGNFTLQTMLSRLGEISHGFITPRLIDVIDRVTNYTDGLTPLLETMLTVSTSVANVQKVSTERLLRNTAGISVATPGMVNASLELGDKLLHSGVEVMSEDAYRNSLGPSLDLISGSFFGALGNLETSHSTDLLPVTNLTKVITDVVPGLVPPDAIADTARELRERLQRLFGGPGDRRAVNVRVILDSLPGVAAPIDAVGGVPQ